MTDYTLYYWPLPFRGQFVRSVLLWGTMTARLPTLRPMLDERAPAIAGLSDRIAGLPEL